MNGVFFRSTVNPLKSVVESSFKYLSTPLLLIYAVFFVLFAYMKNGLFHLKYVLMTYGCPSAVIYIGHFMAAGGCEFYLRVSKVLFISKTLMKFPHKTQIFYSFSKQQNSAI